MLRTVLALVISTGLVACVTDDSEVDTEELAENPDILPEPRGNQIDPTGVVEVPDDLPGSIPAPNQGNTRVHVSNTNTTELDLNRQEERYDDTVVVAGPTDDLDLVRGSFAQNEVGGREIGFSCDGQDVSCRAIEASKATAVIDGGGAGTSDPTRGNGRR